MACGCDRRCKSALRSKQRATYRHKGATAMNEGTTNRTQTSSGNETDELRALATERIRRRRNFQLHIAAYILGTLTVTIVWAVTEYHNAGGWPTGFRTGRQNHDWDPWIIYPLIAGTI